MQHAISDHEMDEGADDEERVAAEVPPPCQSVFLDPNLWSESFAIELPTDQEGKLQCAKCQAKLGHYVWSGTLCSCGQWVSPGFAISKSRIDPVP